MATAYPTVPAATGRNSVVIYDDNGIREDRKKENCQMNAGAKEAACDGLDGSGREGQRVVGVIACQSPHVRFRCFIVAHTTRL